MQNNPAILYNVFLPLSLYTMIQVFLPYCSKHHNSQLIHSPLQFCTPLCIILSFYHLDLLSTMISTLATSLGPWGTIPRIPNPLAAGCSRAHFPMDTGDNCKAIAWHDHPNLGRFANVLLVTLLCPFCHTPLAHVSTAYVLYIALQHWRDCSHSSAGEHGGLLVHSSLPW